MTGRARQPRRTAAGGPVFGEPREPVVRARTDAEKTTERARAAERARVQALEDAAHAEAERRGALLDTASPYDLLGDALRDCVGDAVFVALASPDFAAALRERGYVLAPLYRGEVPEPPVDWAHDAIDLIGGSGAIVQPVDHVYSLWRAAVLAGIALATQPPD